MRERKKELTTLNSYEKSIGSNQGLLSTSLLHFKLECHNDQANDIFSIKKLKNKINKTKLSESSSLNYRKGMKRYATEFKWGKNNDLMNYLRHISDSEFRDPQVDWSLDDGKYIRVQSEKDSAELKIVKQNDLLVCKVEINGYLEDELLVEDKTRKKNNFHFFSDHILKVYKYGFHKGPSEDGSYEGLHQMVYSEFINSLIGYVGLTEDILKKRKKVEEDGSKDIDNFFEEETKNRFHQLETISDDLYVFINIEDDYKFPNDLLGNFLEFRVFLKPETVEINRQCSVCEDHTTIGLPDGDYFAMNIEKKPFNVHQTRKDKLSMRLCRKCIRTLIDFESIMTEKDSVNLFPIFLEGKEKENQIKYLLNTDDWSFFNIIEFIEKNINDGSLNFLLRHKSGDLIYYDYVSNYEYINSTNSRYYSDDYTGRTKKGIYSMLADNDIGFKNTRFFGDLKDQVKDTINRGIIYDYREKIFNYVYRNEKSLTGKDISDIIIRFLEKWVWNDMLNLKKHTIKKLFDLYLNSRGFVRGGNNAAPYLAYTENGGKQIMLEKLQEEKQQLVDGKIDRPAIDHDDVFSYYLGQIIRFILSKTEAENETRLLKPILNCKRPDRLKNIVSEKYLDKYIHNLDGFQGNFRGVIYSETLDYLNKFDGQFDAVKVPFYIGYFDYNIFYMTSKEETNDE